MEDCRRVNRLEIASGNAYREDLGSSFRFDVGYDTVIPTLRLGNSRTVAYRLKGNASELICVYRALRNRHFYHPITRGSEFRRTVMNGHPL